MTTVIDLFCSYSLILVLLLRAVPAIDIFCGTLSIFEQQQFGSNSVAISSHETVDLKQCLELCCSHYNCYGVTFTGVIAPHVGEPNCHLIGCGEGRCEMNERGEYPDGLLSVLINRTQVILC
ncbi:hypothetical protein DICVIV_11978 [Dictyocaulus viviparus]|uniref:PAN domain protein n=1 Tax=Dictyocaulus viviparus TaxID=29172 RepID=A0A0D8XE49_DICVI|nr:hypothetical protein DICVIV_11978 [Dictyocaulus viviparus]